MESQILATPRGQATSNSAKKHHRDNDEEAIDVSSNTPSNEHFRKVHGTNPSTSVKKGPTSPPLQERHR